MTQIRRLAGCLLLVLGLGACANLAGPKPGAGPEAAEDEAGAPAADADPVEAPASEPDATAQDAAEAERALQGEVDQPPGGFTRETLYQLLVADLAGRQGDVTTALQGYMETARDSRDPRIAERATRLALYAGQDELALEAARRWLQLAPDELEAHSIAARLYLRRGEAATAVEHLERVVDLADGDTDAGLHEVAALVSRSSNPQAALAALRDLRKRYADHAVIHYAIGNVAEGLDQLDTAVDALDRALEIDAGYSEARVLRARIWLQTGQEERALQDLRSARVRFPDDRELALGTARMLVAADRDEAAREAIQRTFEAYGNDSFAVYSLALMAMQIGAWDDARIFLERLLAMEQRTSTAHYYLGRIAEQEADCTEALRHYIRVGRGEHRFDAELRAAECMARLGRADEARLHLGRLKNEYEEASARIRIATTRAQIEQIAGDPARALAVLSNAVERYPEHTGLRYTRALTAAEQDRFELARGDLEFILEQDPDDARALNALGYLLADRNQELNRARDMIERALKQNPEDAATIDSMGWVLYRQGHYAEAVEYLRAAWERDPDAEIAAHLGEVLWALGRREQAREIWEEARELEPDSEILRETIERLTR